MRAPGVGVGSPADRQVVFHARPEMAEPPSVSLYTDLVSGNSRDPTSAVALRDLRKRIASMEPRALETALSSLGRTIAGALDLAIKLGPAPAVEDGPLVLWTERGRAGGAPTWARTDLPTTEELMPAVREKLRNAEATIRADPVHGRLVLAALLWWHRLRVHRDGRIEGVFGRGPKQNCRPPGSPRGRQTRW